MAGTLSYIGLNRFDSKVTVKSGGGAVTGSFSVDGLIDSSGSNKEENFKMFSKSRLLTALYK